MDTHFGTIPIDFETYKRIKANVEQDELKEIASHLTKTIVGYYAPESTRWHRNHSDVAEWYFLWKDKI